MRQILLFTICSLTKGSFEIWWSPVMFSHHLNTNEVVCWCFISLRFRCFWWSIRLLHAKVSPWKQSNLPKPNIWWFQFLTDLTFFFDEVVTDTIFWLYWNGMRYKLAVNCLIFLNSFIIIIIIIFNFLKIF